MPTKKTVDWIILRAPKDDIEQLYCKMYHYENEYNPHGTPFEVAMHSSHGVTFELHQYMIKKGV